jgi:hypothetical protein
MLRIPHCLENRLTDGGKAVSPRDTPYFTPQKHYFNVSGSHFCYRLSNPQGLVRPEGLGTFKTTNDFMARKADNLNAICEPTV